MRSVVQVHLGPPATTLALALGSGPYLFRRLRRLVTRLRGVDRLHWHWVLFCTRFPKLRRERHVLSGRVRTKKIIKCAATSTIVMCLLVFGFALNGGNAMMGELAADAAIAAGVAVGSRAESSTYAMRVVNGLPGHRGDGEAGHCHRAAKPLTRPRCCLGRDRTSRWASQPRG